MGKGIFREEIVHADYCMFKNEIDFVDKLISIYSIIDMPADKQLRRFEKEILNYYIRFGYSTDTKRRIKKELGKDMSTITQVNFYLSKKGYLKPSKNNFSQKNLNKGLERIRRNFLLGDKKVMAIGFMRK